MVNRSVWSRRPGELRCGSRSLRRSAPASIAEQVWSCTCRKRQGRARARSPASVTAVERRGRLLASAPGCCAVILPLPRVEIYAPGREGGRCWRAVAPGQDFAAASSSKRWEGREPASLRSRYSAPTSRPRLAGKPPETRRRAALRCRAQSLWEATLSTEWRRLHPPEPRCLQHSRTRHGEGPHRESAQPTALPASGSFMVHSCAR
jgi:hypothetical protein